MHAEVEPTAQRNLRRRLMCLIAALGAACSPGTDPRSPAAGDRSPDVLLVVLDTVRRDFTSLGAGLEPESGVELTPELERFAAQGTRFSDAWANAPWTVPSHASMFTGLLPSQHRITSLDPRLSDPEPTLAERFAAAGYETAAFLSNPWLSDQASGLLRGFDRRHLSPLDGVATAERGDQGGEETSRSFASWLAGRSRTRPFFAFVNLLEAHLPYDPPAAIRQRHGLGSDPIATIPWSHRVHASLLTPTADDWQTVSRLYRADVERADELLGEILDALEATGYGEAVVVVASDHGESLGEEGRVEHQFCLCETLLAVPLAIRAPGRLPAGAVRPDPVMLSDLFATLLELAGLKVPDRRGSSRSLLLEGSEERPLLAHYAGGPSGLIATLKRLNPELDTAPLERRYASVRIGDLRLTQSSDGGTTLAESGGPPDTDLADRHPELVSRMLGLLERMTLATGSGDDGGTGFAPGELDPELRRQLERLGYL